jgi:hypothetical protein
MSIKITGDPLPNPNISNPLSTFVIRVWREWSVDGGIWRGNIEHLESKKRTGFQDAESIIDFLRSFGVLNEVNSDD